MLFKRLPQPAIGIVFLDACIWMSKHWRKFSTWIARTLGTYMFCVHSVPGNPYFRSDAFSLGINMHMLCKFQA